MQNNFIRKNEEVGLVTMAKCMIVVTIAVVVAMSKVFPRKSSLDVRFGDGSLGSRWALRARGS